MFTMTIVDSDAFLDMPLSAQCLYFHLNMRADDDGFVGNPKRIASMIGCNVDDLKLLIAKNFVLVFDSGVLVIKHWRMHNTLSQGRYKETAYLDEKNQLLLKENGSYSVTEGMVIDDSHQVMMSQRQVKKCRQTKDEQKTNEDKNRLDKNREEENNKSLSELQEELINEFNKKKLTDKDFKMIKEIKV